MERWSGAQLTQGLVVSKVAGIFLSASSAPLSAEMIAATILLCSPREGNARCLASREATRAKNAGRFVSCTAVPVGNGKRNGDMLPPEGALPR